MEVIDVKAAKEYVMGNYPNDPLLKHIATSLLDQLPQVEAEVVAHEHWCWEGQFKACSRCGSYVEWNETLGANFWNFCPHCGAKMDGVNKDEPATSD